MKEVTDEKLTQYFQITGEALSMVKNSKIDEENRNSALEFLDMAERYYSDAEYFKSKNDFVLAFGALNYAHAWLDAGAKLGFFKVKDSRLFTVDD